ncbi:MULTISPECIES: lysophospholipid acyltransferase family protein [unclassified Methylophaga]|jgi:1-acyl-sn-glycerol-3-phosphate acyltransferase|uniref:lysophospholipid acyltransferase family protein n=2 Tax=Methylophaga TaxID=40222 RepID=UPI000C8A1CA5|nr:MULTISPECIES: lysophospholipid acyltransferase family protein [unclassified Methylophaga]MAK66302.1 1-acyl-sn-glycerol-3-phosphate acyltransferase [Methylophaga sp.]MAY17497.1 1-acyl-sn-glycerol-3-phosphate acyltransferase [Methylophaga sp.]MBN47439.1 1-acyl-sn-glycerol-3-phosphate acyltransferase [Methylophaga sp.]HAO25385.1 1-acyl-sn-glycerol-3-phosphate acyltransferase [Methylophaga sp.]HCD04220.1 1-acyl-sn-glycerol-3-phosphate acyltransferase [Methylophaga sp.]|tara:strand:- start:11149 stop:11901 length:753 start_codon:yes stop_codon:yes gene_type:complete
MQTFRSFIFLIIYATTAILFSVVGVLIWPLPFKQRYWVVSRWAVMNIWLLKIICGLKLEVEGRENIPNEPCVVLCKHQSAWETLALQAVFPPQVWVLKRELLWIPFFGWGLASLRPIAIDRNAGRQALNQVIEQGKERLQSGAMVVVFPEGTRLPPGTIGRFGIGGARLAVDAGVPVVPVAHNAGSFWAKSGFLKRPGVIRMVIGAKIDTQVLSATAVNQQVYDWMALTMTQLEGSAPVQFNKGEQRGES